MDNHIDALSFLKNDHRKLLKLLNEICTTDVTEENRLKELFKQAKSELLVHEKIEEKLFYPKLKKEDESKPLALEAYEEHHFANVMMKELEQVDFSDEQWKAKFSVFRENIKHHIKEEEGELFKYAKKILSKNQLNEMGEAMQKIKDTEQNK